VEATGKTRERESTHIYPFITLVNNRSVCVAKVYDISQLFCATVLHGKELQGGVEEEINI
jgi:hypothetical protein